MFYFQYFSQCLLLKSTLGSVPKVRVSVSGSLDHWGLQREGLSAPCNKSQTTTDPPTGREGERLSHLLNWVWMAERKCCNKRLKKTLPLQWFSPSNWRDFEEGFSMETMGDVAQTGNSSANNWTFKCVSLSGSKERGKSQGKSTGLRDHFVKNKISMVINS